MNTMDQDIKKMFEDGLITEDTAVTHMVNPQMLR